VKIVEKTNPGKIMSKPNAQGADQNAKEASQKNRVGATQQGGVLFRHQNNLEYPISQLVQPKSVAQP
jgi:hypothetical protein